MQGIHLLVQFVLEHQNLDSDFIVLKTFGYWWYMYSEFIIYVITGLKVKFTRSRSSCNLIGFRNTHTHNIWMRLFCGQGLCCYALSSFITFLTMILFIPAGSRRHIEVEGGIVDQVLQLIETNEDFTLVASVQQQHNNTGSIFSIQANGKR